MKNLFGCFLLLYFQATLWAQTDAPVPENGKCYAKCTLVDKVEVVGQTYPVFTGRGPTQVDLDTLQWTEEAHTEWVKKRAEPNCRSANPEDCLIWCLVQVPAQTRSAVVVRDTAQTKDYVWEDFSTKTLVERRNEVKLCEVLCGERVTADVVLQLRKALRSNGYETTESGNQLDTGLKDQVQRYQFDQGLPIGGLNFETLDSLGISVR